MICFSNYYICFCLKYLKKISALIRLGLAWCKELWQNGTSRHCVLLINHFYRYHPGYHPCAEHSSRWIWRRHQKEKQEAEASTFILRCFSWSYKVWISLIYVFTCNFKAKENKIILLFMVLSIRLSYVLNYSVILFTFLGSTTPLTPFKYGLTLFLNWYKPDQKDNSEAMYLKILVTNWSVFLDCMKAGL